MKLKIFLPLLTLTSCGLQADFTFTPRLEVGSTAYQIDMWVWAPNESLVNPEEYVEYNLDDSLVNVGLGGTSTFGNLYFDIDYKMPVDKASSSNSFEATDLNFYELRYSENSVLEYDRSDLALTLGYNFGFMNLFVGYKSGAVDIEGTGSGVETSPGQLASESAYTHSGTFRGSFDSSGIYAGASVGFELSDYLYLSLSGAFASMSADAEFEKNFTADYDDGGDDTTSTYSPVFYEDATGLSMSGTLFIHQLYLKTEFQEYEFSEPEGNANTTESVTRFSIGYVF